MLIVIQVVILTLFAVFLFRAAYRISIWHPLSHVPGPWWTAISSTWLQYHTLRGTQARGTQALHLRFGSIVRVAPNEVEIADGAAIRPIYIQNGGFDKSHHYAMLDIDGHSTVFSTLQNRNRTDRLRIALPFFSSASVQQQVPMLEDFARQLIKLLQRDKNTQLRTDLLDHCRCFALDSTSTYVFGEAFGVMNGDQPSVAPVVDSFLESNLVFNVPRHLSSFSSWCYNAFYVGKNAKKSDLVVDRWIRSVIDKTLKEEGSDKQRTYPGRLAITGMPLSKVVSEGKDAIFGATDAVGLTLALILWRLTSDEQLYTVLREELKSNCEVRGEKLQSLPILAGIIKESLRINSTVPCKLPRQTPPEGMLFDGTYIPGGVVVGVAPYMMHFNSQVFPDPDNFSHERWHDPSKDMIRDWMPFGKGARACMGRHLAMIQLCVAVAVIVKSGILDGAHTVMPTIKFWEWYNVKVEGGKIEIRW